MDFTNFQEIVMGVTAILVIVYAGLSVRDWYQKRKWTKMINTMVTLRFADPGSPTSANGESPPPILQGIEPDGILTGQGKHILNELASKNSLAYGLAKQEVLSSAWSTSATASPREISKVVEEKISEVTDRIKKIEDQSSGPASFNADVLGARIDGLAKDISDIKKEMLSKWDVLKVLGWAIGIVLAISGTFYKVLKAFGLITTP